MATWEGKPTLASVLKGYVPPTESALADPIKEHLRTLPAQLATNQAALDKAMSGWNKTDFATGQPNPNYYPEAIAELTQLMPNVGGLTAWHGTPHKIQGAFDISKVGTGEGAQAYGHGMYFAEAPAVAEQYKTALSNIEMTAKGKPLTAFGVNEKVTTHSPGIFDNPLDYGLAEYNKTLKTQLLDYPELKNDLNYPKQLLDERIDFLKSWGKGTKEAKAAEALESFVKKNGYPDVNVSGNLYKVDIPDEYIPNMLDWDKPLSEQPKSVQKALAKLDPDLYSPKGMDYEPTELGQTIYHRLQNVSGKQSALFKQRDELLNKYMTDNRSMSEAVKSMPANDRLKFSEIAQQIDNLKNSPQEASKLLNESGITGIRYLDAGSRGTGKGSSNFVVFDPSTVKILEENGKPLTRKEILEKQLKKVVE